MQTLLFDREKLTEICLNHDVRSLSLFGSMARGEQTSKSDIDLLVAFSQRKSLLSMIRLERELSEFLGRPVDLLTEAALSPYLREQVLQEATEIYAA